MKPIAVKVDKDDNVQMTFNEFKRALDEAYRQGKEDAGYKYWYPNWTYSYYTGTDTTVSPSITCGSSSAVSITTATASEVK